MGLSSCASQSSAAANATNLSAGNSLNDPPGANFNSGHGVTLSWNASTSSGIVGYNIYRGTVPGGPYVKVNTSMVAATSYTDSAVQAGQTYYYLVTAVSSSNMESTYSNEVVASIP